MPPSNLAVLKVHSLIFLCLAFSCNPTAFSENNSKPVISHAAPSLSLQTAGLLLEECSWCAHGDDTCDRVCDRVKDTFPLSISPLVSHRGLPYWRSHAQPPLGEPHPATRLAIFVHHGSLRNANEYFCYVQNAVKPKRNAVNNNASRPTSSRYSAEEVLVLAPNFLERGDADLDEARDVWWPRQGGDDGQSEWAWGGDSSPDLPTRISSFQVLDEMLEVLARRHLYPNLEAVVFVGHSAGGQIVQRYAVFGVAARQRLETAGVKVTYFPANPSSFLYLDTYRPNLVPFQTRKGGGVPPKSSAEIPTVRRLLDEVRVPEARELGFGEKEDARAGLSGIVTRFLSALVSGFSTRVQTMLAHKSAEGEVSLDAARTLSRPKESMQSHLMESTRLPSKQLNCDTFCSNATISLDSYEFVNLPDVMDRCPLYNSYGYGLEGPMVPYVAKLSLKEVVESYRYADVHYVSSESDVCNKQAQKCLGCTPQCVQEDHGLDASCEAYLQGRCRMQRSHAYFQYIQQYYSSRIGHRLISIPNVGHSGCGVFQSKEFASEMGW